MRHVSISPVRLHNDVWDLLDTMGPDSATYKRDGVYIIFDGASSRDVASWLFRLQADAKVNIINASLQDNPDKDAQILLARLLVDLEQYLGGFDGSLFLYWLTGEVGDRLQGKDYEMMSKRLSHEVYRRKQCYDHLAFEGESIAVEG